jgi:chromatin remodeling complex protein RSC6
MAANSGLAKPWNLSPELEAIVGKGPLPRTEVTKKVWDYIKANNLQNPENKREIRPDATLGKVLGNEPINMLQMTKVISGHMTPTESKASEEEEESMPMAA